MNVLDTFRKSMLGYTVPAVVHWGDWMDADAAHLYTLLRAYYDQNGLYERTESALYDRGIWHEGMKGLRNPAYRAVEFYAAKLWPGVLPEALPIVTEHEDIVDPIEQVWGWSNWGAQKQVAARQFAMLGDLFIKVVQREDKSRVYFQIIDPAFVTDFDTDERGYLTYCRIDVPRTNRDGDTITRVTHTEVWTKDRYRRWEHERDATTELRQLGNPLDDLSLSTFGIDFIPIVHAKFRDVGNDRGAGCFTHALDKIDEANRSATRLHQMLFRHNDATWAVTTGADAQGRPLPPVKVGLGTQVTVGDSRFVSLPGGADLKSLVPAIQYDAALNVLNAHMDEIEKDLPELAYYKLREMGQISGVAVRSLLSDAIDKAIEARANAETALVRANQIALTLGTNAGLFQGLGTFAAGDFEHSFERRDIIPLNATELAARDMQDAQTGVIKHELGVPIVQVLSELGYSAEQVAEFEQQRSLEQTNLGGALLTSFNTGAGQ